MTEIVEIAPSNTTSSTPSQKKQNKIGDYNLLQTLGEGEFGKVKLGVHTETGEEVAIKLIRKDGAGSDGRINKVEREISILRNLRHPYIVKLHNVLETEKYVGIILEYASGKKNTHIHTHCFLFIIIFNLFHVGGELFEYILAHRYLKEKDAKRFFAQLVSSVQYMHKCKIVHRDLKLENILIDKNRNIIVTDFGFANQFSTAADDMMATTCGSPCYAAPELVVNAGLYAGSAVDIWSCGVILFAMLSGYLPFDDDPTNPDSDDISQLYRYIVSTRLVFPSHISPEACDLMEKMLVPDPTKRCTLDTVAKHPWLSEYKELLVRDQKTPFVETVVKPKQSTPAPNDDFQKEKLVKPARYHSIRYHSTSRSSKIPNFITRKPVKEVKPLENGPEKSLSASYLPTEAIKNWTGSVRIHPHKEKIFGFFGKAKAAEEGSETSTLGNSSSSLNTPEDSTIPKSIFMRLAQENEKIHYGTVREHRQSESSSYRPKRNSILQESFENSSSVEPDSTHSTRFTLAAVRKSIYRRNPENVKDSKPQRNTWAATERTSPAVPKTTGKKMMDWIKKKSHKQESSVKKDTLKPKKQDEASGRKRTDAPQTSRGRTLSSNALAFVKEESSDDIGLQIHQGPIDRTALTSRSPQKVIQEVSRILLILGIEAVPDEGEGPFVLRCTRRKASKRKDEKSLQPIYGEPAIDNGDEVRFIVEICRFKNLPGLFIVNVKRLKGNVWAYKFLYHKLIDFLDLGKEDYMQKKVIFNLIKLCVREKKKKKNLFFFFF
ncbi:kinase-like domain-containing protein [Sporodiniella umbellata]|nr:kinase-like domain-containing protein [Sporodiniella umbellata]